MSNEVQCLRTISSASSQFVEIIIKEEKEEKERFVNAVVCHLSEPKHCQILMKELDSILPLRYRSFRNKNKEDVSEIFEEENEVMGHLRRIRRVYLDVQEEDAGKDDKPVHKRQRKNNATKKGMKLEVLIHSNNIIDGLFL